MSEKAALEVSGHIDHLIASRRYNTGVEEVTKAWLCTADNALLKKLNALGSAD